MENRRSLKTLLLIFTFYKSHLLADIVITCAGLWVFYSRGLEAFQGIIWLKIISSAVIYYFVNELNKHQYYYYQNLGLRKSTLWAVTLTIDFMLYIVLIILTYHLR